MTCGIYRINNKKNHKSYVGCSHDIASRLESHYRMLNRVDKEHHSKDLQDDWDKYGPDYFVAEILEVCPEHKLEEREKYWIDYYKAGETGYNTKVDYNKGIKAELDNIIKEIEKLKKRL